MFKIIFLAMLTISGWCESFVKVTCQDTAFNHVGWLIKEHGVTIYPAEGIADHEGRLGVKIRMIRNDETVLEIKRKNGHREVLAREAADWRVDAVGSSAGIFSCVLRDQIKSGDTALAISWLNLPADTKAEDIINILDRFNVIIEKQYEHQGEWADK